MAVLEIDGLSVYYEVHGSGPAILIPSCNFAWSSLDLEAFARGHTVVLASPRGFGNSDRVAAGYEAATIRSDLEAVLDHLRIQEYVAFGYSMTGSVAAWLAHDNPRVQAVVSGGFPTVTSYAGLLPYIRANRAETEQDAARWQAMTRKFDPDALLAWYLHLDTIPAGGLVDRLTCPIYCYWGGDDEVIDELVGLSALHREAVDRGLSFQVIPGMDHEGLLHNINLAMPGVRSWLHRTLPARHDSPRDVGRRTSPGVR